MTVEEAIARFEAEREKIWMTSPDDVTALGQGIVPRRTGARGQYLSTIIFAEGEARTFADEMLWGIIRVCEDTEADLATMQAIIDQIIGYKASFFDFVSLPSAAEMTRLYVDASKTCVTTEELARLSHAALGYANRLHMWVDYILPWGLGDAFKRKPAQGDAR